MYNCNHNNLQLIVFKINNNNLVIIIIIIINNNNKAK